MEKKQKQKKNTVVYIYGTFMKQVITPYWLETAVPSPALFSSYEVNKRKTVQFMLMINHTALCPHNNKAAKGAALPLTQETPPKNNKEKSPLRKLHHSNNYMFDLCMWHIRHASPRASCYYSNKV